MLANQSNTAGVEASRMPSAPSPDLSGVKTFKKFAAQVIGRADLSRAASRVAVQKAARADVKEFAGYELMEAETFVAVLDELGTPVPAMGADARAALAQIVDAPAGSAFDTAYMAAEYENHAFLRDLAAAYLGNADVPAPDVAEAAGRRLARVALFAFTEHTGITHRILREFAA